MAFRLDIKKKKRGQYLTIEKKYWDKEKKRPVTEHYKSLGYVADLQKEHTNPIVHFKEEVSLMNAERKKESKVSLVLDMNGNSHPIAIPDTTWATP